MAALLARRSVLFALTLSVVLAPLGLAWAQGACVDLAGCWTCGSWKSCCTGHHGKLSARITCCNACTYECTFSGTFFKVLPFCYKVPLRVTRVSDGVVHFSARKKIPLFGGDFTCCGTATHCQFHARYTSPKDHGEFRMSR